jgi:ABC-type dipeptide/oligopeptide/nickel transport system permease component
MALTLVIAILTVLGSLMADIAYSLIDHRIQFA